MKLLFFIPRMSGGGAERVLSEIANRLAEDGFDITIATIGDGQDFYYVDDRIRRMRLGLSRQSKTLAQAFVGNIRTYFTIRHTVLMSGVSVVVSFLDRTNVRVLLATIGLRITVVVSEHSHPGTHPIGLIWAVLRRLLYRRARFLVAVGRGVYNWFSWIPRERRVIIHNPLPRIRLESDASQIPLPVNRKRLVSVGRFVPSKAFDVLIRTFALLATDYPEWDLMIVGDGPLREELRELAVSLGISSRCRFTGVVANLHGVLRQCDLFCLTSTTEGFGMVILEAMQAGLPVISTDCPTGPRELIQHGQNGLLVPVGDQDELVRALRTLMADPSERSRLVASTGPILVRHSMDNIIEKWKYLLASC